MAISELWVMQRSNAPNVAGRTVQAVKISGEWLDCEFGIRDQFLVGRYSDNFLAMPCTLRELNGS